MMVFHWSLSDNKSPQVSRTLLNILTDLNNAVVWVVFIIIIIIIIIYSETLFKENGYH